MVLTLFEPSIQIGSREPVALEGVNVTRLHSRAARLVETDLEQVRLHLHKYAEDKGLYRDPGNAPLPPFQAINHQIPLIEPDLIIGLGRLG